MAARISSPGNVVSGKVVKYNQYGVRRAGVSRINKTKLNPNVQIQLQINGLSSLDRKDTKKQVSLNCMEFLG